MAMRHKILVILTLAAFIGIILATLDPVHSTFQKLELLAGLASLWLGSLLLCWKHQKTRWVLFTLPALLMLPLLLPARPIDRSELQADYVRRMEALDQTPYIWGGENRKGIDCSGLPRKALRDALLVYGLRHGNGGAIHLFACQWWFDATAKNLAAGHRGTTVPLTPSGTIREMNYSNLIPGDLAVTADRIHILAYLGGDRWIQADPGIGAVAILNGHTADNDWFKTPVTLHRWTVLASTTHP